MATLMLGVATALRETILKDKAIGFLLDFPFPKTSIL